MLVQQQSSPHVVLVSVLCFLDDELSVKQDEAAHDEQPEVHVCLPETTCKNYDSETMQAARRHTQLMTRLVRLSSATLNSITDPKNMFITDIRNRRERPDISVPERSKNSTYGSITQCFI